MMRKKLASFDSAYLSDVDKVNLRRGQRHEEMRRKFARGMEKDKGTN